jgi:putative GTP pyrophosphokinase
MTQDECIESAIQAFLNNKHDFELFQDGIVNFFHKHPSVVPHIHSVRSRIKDPDHLRRKLERNWDKTGPINGENVFEKVTDLAGVRVLHLYQEQFELIHTAIDSKISNQDWILGETPVAYTWDPECESFFGQFGLIVKEKPSFYTSIHYIVRPRQGDISCEIQVRTLFEEIWGEVDHTVNYPDPSPSKACREQIRVLSKLVGAGSRLVDAIFRTHRSDS